MKKTITLLSFLSFFFLKPLHSECVLVPLSLQDRVNASTLIVEAMVGAKTSYWNAEGTMIYTSSTLVVSKVYKGAEYLQGKSVNLITLGGFVGQKAIKVEPELETETGEIGIFMLINKNGEWVAESGPQGWIKIDKHTAEAHDVFSSYPAFSIANTIQGLTGIAPVAINELLTKVRLFTKRAAPSISSLSPLTITAGTSSVLTIKGTNFLSTIDTSSVQFKDADNGGLSFTKALKRDYISWSDTMIKLIVRTKAGTGKIRVVIGGNGIVNSTDTLKITYAHLNVVSGDSIGYETQEIGMNVNNGITWKMNKSFFDSTGARGAFTRSLERWRCGTYINWDTLGRVNHSAIKPDGVNICAWDTNSNMPSGVLAQCFSYWSGCFTPGLKWYVNELDIRFRIKPTGSTNWNYTTGNASGTQFHFESVATHELGHGHQMGHVINSPVVMHYSIANGQTKPNLSSNDISAGNYVISKSGTSICGKNAHTKLNSGNCAMVAPNANFKMNKSDICKNETIIFTDSSQGNISAYTWNFGADASPATANTKGPHTVTYSSGGSKSISLTIATITGNLVKTKNATVRADTRMVSKFTYIAAEKGNVTFTNTSNNPNNNMWYFGDGDSTAFANPSHLYPSGGTFSVRLKAANTCDSRDTTLQVKFAWLNFYHTPSSACINENMTYFDSSDNNVSTWQWVFAGGTPSTATGKGPHMVSYSVAGMKSTTLNITVAGAPNQSYKRNNTVNIGTDTFTKASFIFGYYGKNLVGFNNTSQGSNMSYKWYFGDGDSSTLKHPLHQYTNANLQNVRLLVTGNCTNDDTMIQLRDFTSVASAHLSSGFKLYPNPSNQFIVIQSDKTESVFIQLVDITGKIICSKTASTGEKISTDELPEGLYFIKIQGNSSYESLLLMVQHP